MTVITKLLSGKAINTDSDFSKYIETVSEAGVISGLQVSSNSVAVGKCWVKCERTNGETIFPLVINDSAKTIDTSGTGYVIVEIGQTYIDDGSLINEDGTSVAEIKVVSSLPTKNYIKLASISSGTITDSRNMIKKVGELQSQIDSNDEDIEDLDERVEALEKAGAVDSLQDNDIIGEKYTSSNILFKQSTPTLNDSTREDCKVGDTSANTEIHIQRIFNGTESNKLKIKVKMYGSPTTNLKVEVRKGIQVSVSSTEAYWYGDETNIIATGSINYSDITTTFAEKEITLDNNIIGNEGDILDVVLYQESGGTKIVNASNYYILGCDSTQSSECFSFVSVNGTTRSRSKYMPYCISNSFKSTLLSKINADGLKRGVVPFGKPKEVKNIGQEGYITIYGIIKTSYISKNVYVNTSGAITDSSTNIFSFIGLSDKYGNVLFDGINIKKGSLIFKPETVQTYTYSWSYDYQHAAETYTYTIPYDGLCYLSINYRQSGSSWGSSSNRVKINSNTVLSEKGNSRFTVRAGDVIELHTGGSYDSASMNYRSF